MIVLGFIYGHASRRRSRRGYAFRCHATARPRSRTTARSKSLEADRGDALLPRRRMISADWREMNASAALRKG